MGEEDQKGIDLKVLCVEGRRGVAGRSRMGREGIGVGSGGKTLCSVINVMNISGSLGRVAADLILTRVRRDH